MILAERGKTRRGTRLGVDPNVDAVWRALGALAPYRTVDRHRHIEWDQIADDVAHSRDVLVSELRNARLGAIEGTLWRYRRWKSGPAPAAVENDFFHAKKPTPTDEGRFHGFTESGHYLGRTWEHLSVEAAQYNQGGLFLIGEFNVSRPKGSFLWLRPEDTEATPAINYVLFESERNRSEALAGGFNDPYAGSQWLRKLARRVHPKLDGIVYPTVQGPFADDSEAWNVIAFSEEAVKSIEASFTGRFLVRTLVGSQWQMPEEAGR